MREICICDVFSMYKKMMEINLMRNVNMWLITEKEILECLTCSDHISQCLCDSSTFFSQYQLLEKGNIFPLKQTLKQKMIINLEAQVLVPMTSFAVLGLEHKQNQRKGKWTSGESQVGREWAYQEWERKMHCPLFTESGGVKWVWPRQAIDYYFYSVCFLNYFPSPQFSAFH